jgi:predicted nucleotidyltransferase
MAPTGMAATSTCWSMRLPGTTLLDLGDLEEELKSLLGVDVDLLTPGDLPPKFRAKVLAEAQPV